MAKKPTGIYTSKAKENLLFTRARINGVLCAAYVKNGELISYEPWDSVNQQMYTGPCLEFTVPEDTKLGQPWRAGQLNK